MNLIILKFFIANYSGDKSTSTSAIHRTSKSTESTKTTKLNLTLSDGTESRVRRAAAITKPLNTVVLSGNIKSPAKATKLTTSKVTSVQDKSAEAKKAIKSKKAILAVKKTATSAIEPDADELYKQLVKSVEMKRAGKKNVTKNSAAFSKNMATIASSAQPSDSTTVVGFKSTFKSTSPIKKCTKVCVQKEKKCESTNTTNPTHNANQSIFRKSLQTIDAIELKNSLLNFSVYK